MNSESSPKAGGGKLSVKMSAVGTGKHARPATHSATLAGLTSLSSPLRRSASITPSVSPQRTPSMRSPATGGLSPGALNLTTSDYGASPALTSPPSGARRRRTVGAPVHPSREGHNFVEFGPSDDEINRRVEAELRRRDRQSVAKRLEAFSVSCQASEGSIRPLFVSSGGHQTEIEADEVDSRSLRYRTMELERDELKEEVANLKVRVGEMQEHAMRLAAKKMKGFTPFAVESGSGDAGKPGQLPPTVSEIQSEASLTPTDPLEAASARIASLEAELLVAKGRISVKDAHIKTLRESLQATAKRFAGVARAAADIRGEWVQLKKDVAEGIAEAQQDVVNTIRSRVSALRPSFLGNELQRQAQGLRMEVSNLRQFVLDATRSMVVNGQAEIAKFVISPGSREKRLVRDLHAVTVKAVDATGASVYLSRQQQKPRAGASSPSASNGGIDRGETFSALPWRHDQTLLDAAPTLIKTLKGITAASEGIKATQEVSLIHRTNTARNAEKTDALSDMVAQLIQCVDGSFTSLLGIDAVRVDIADDNNASVASSSMSASMGLIRPEMASGAGSTLGDQIALLTQTISRTIGAVQCNADRLAGRIAMAKNAPQPESASLGVGTTTQSGAYGSAVFAPVTPLRPTQVLEDASLSGSVPVFTPIAEPQPTPVKAASSTVVEVDKPLIDSMRNQMRVSAATAAVQRRNKNKVLWRWAIKTVRSRLRFGRVAADASAAIRLLGSLTVEHKTIMEAAVNVATASRKNMTTGPALVEVGWSNEANNESSTKSTPAMGLAATPPTAEATPPTAITEITDGSASVELSAFRRQQHTRPPLTARPPPSTSFSSSRSHEQKASKSESGAAATSDPNRVRRLLATFEDESGNIAPPLPPIPHAAMPGSQSAGASNRRRRQMLREYSSPREAPEAQMPSRHFRQRQPSLGGPQPRTNSGAPRRVFTPRTMYGETPVRDVLKTFFAQAAQQQAAMQGDESGPPS